MRSFGLVEEKIYETDFFLEQMKHCDDLRECQYYLSAFLSACRSITFVLQAAMGDVDGFMEWYEAKRKELANNKLARFFHNARNECQKVGIYHIKAGHSCKDEFGVTKMRFFFSNSLFPKNKTIEVAILEMLMKAELDESECIEEDDVIIQCEIHFRFILEIIFDCFNKFGCIIDPSKYYTIDNINKLGLSVEDVEESLGYGRGWTKVNGISEKKRIELIREHQPDSFIDPIFIKYLNKTRYEI